LAFRKGTQLQLAAPDGLPEVRAGDDLAELVLAGCADAAWHVQPGDCFVLAQKIVSKAEGRSVPLDTVQPSPQAEELAAVTRKDAWSNWSCANRFAWSGPFLDC
jgi:coenzyme F420-0:L-glutamate ligase / coenzyme F420-1:gamma-L-glutamate ligase